MGNIRFNKEKMRQNKIKIKIKKLVTEAVIPSFAHAGDACMDLTAISKNFVEESGFGYIEYGFGLSFEIPPNHAMLIFPRSSISNTGLLLSNAVGVVDETYRGEVKARFKWVKGAKEYSIGDRIAQFMVIPRPIVEIEEVEELSNSERGQGGFGSSGS